jgi:hypothetical protein
MVGAHSESGIDAEAKIQALEQILQSETFARSERLKSLLRFICEAEIDGREGELNEYVIGTMALGRPRDFAPLEDSSVRSRAHELRQKLEKYYAQESPSAGIRIELRKGSYVPRFNLVREAPEADPLPSAVSVPLAVYTGADERSAIAPPAAAPPAVVVSQNTSNRVVWVALFAFLGGAAVMFGAVAVWSMLARPGVRLPATHLEAAAGTVWTPELETLWRPIVAGGAPLLIAFETRFFVRAGPLMVRDWHVNSPDTAHSSESLMRVQQLFGFRRYGNRDYTDAGTPSAVFFLTRLLSNRIPNMFVKNSLDLTAADLRDNNVILLGKPSMDPQIERMLSNGELVDAGGKVLNVHPASGEPTQFNDQSDATNPDRWALKYSVITMMPGSGGGRRILTLTGQGSEQPGALAWYMTNPDMVRDLVARMHPAAGVGSDYYQVLVRAEYKSKAVVKVEYITHRILKAR